MDRRAHWEQVYQAKSPLQVSWYQSRPATSLSLIEQSGIGRDEAIIDVGGGASTLVDHLLDAGFRSITVLDISRTAIEHAQRRLGPRAAQVTWLEADVLSFQPPRRFALWHDRAVFHFLTEQADRARYISALKAGLGSRGRAVVATFAVDGPTTCSGLPVARYGRELIEHELGGDFELLDCVDETHITPWNSQQKFTYFQLRRKSS